MCCSSLAKCILIIINMVFMVVAIGLVVAGVILAFVPSVVLEPAYKIAKEEAAKEGYSMPDSAKDLKDIPLVYNIGLALLIFGIFLFALSAMGYCGSCCTTCCKCLLVLFAIIMFVLMIGEIVVGSLFYVTDSPLHKTIKSELKDKIKSDFNERSNDSFSTAINLINKYFECCGIDGGGDFNGKPHHSCDAKYENTGCYKKLTNLIDDNILYCGLVLGGLLLLQLVEALLAIFIYKSSNKILPI